MQFYTKSDKLLHIQYPFEARFVEPANVLQVVDDINKHTNIQKIANTASIS